VQVPVSRSSTPVSAIVSAVDVPESRVASFRSVVKTIPSGSRFSSLKPIAPPRESTAFADEPPIDDSEIPIDDLEIMVDDIGSLESGSHRSIDLVPTSTQVVITIGPQYNPSIARMETEVTQLRTYALSRTITCDADTAPATDDLSIIAKTKKAVTAEKDKYCKPIKGYLDDVTGVFKRILDILEEADKANRTKLNAYLLAQIAHAAEIAEVNRQAELLARRQAELSGTGEFTVDTTPIEAPAPIKHVYTGSGTASIGNAPATWEEEDWDKVPKEYKMLNSVLIGKVIRAGGTIPGIRVIRGTTIPSNHKVAVTKYVSSAAPY
jgi:hypothetical protein